MKSIGFTLIELLIVVLIIAILAAIAVPNFLQFQVRAKVARCKSDMRSQAMALEAYAVDWNRYPFPGGIRTSDSGVEIPNLQPAGYSLKFVAPVLTTPVAYITAIPADVFAPRTPPIPELQRYFYTNLLRERDWYAEHNQPFPPAMRYRLDNLGPWIMMGCGPDKDRIDINPTSVGNNLILGFYDPTNGTISNGDILRTSQFTSLGG